MGGVCPPIRGSLIKVHNTCFGFLFLKESGNMSFRVFSHGL